VFSADVHAWETVKVRMLNGTHSLIASLGLLRGHALVADAFADGAVRRAADALGDEYAPTLAVPAELDLADYRRALARRFANAALGHRTAQVATDGSLKLAQRVPEPVRWHAERGSVPGALALLVAAFLAGAARPELVDEARAGRPREPAADRLRELGRACPDGAGLARAVLVDDALLGAGLAGQAAFVARVGELLDVLTRSGTEAAIHEVLLDPATPTAPPEA
jgi:fructuronate reductase